MNLFRQRILFAFTILCSGLAAEAQQQAMEPERPGIDTAAVIANQKAEFAKEVSLLLDELARTCKLTNSQTKKLQLASKGATDAAMREWETQIRSIYESGPGGAAAAGDELKIDQYTLSRIRWVHVPVKNQSRWLKGVDSILTAEQKAKLAKEEESRRQFRRRLGVQQRLDAYDHITRLTAKQREQLSPVIDRVLGDWLAQEEPPGQVPMLFGDVPYLVRRDMQTILSETQLSLLFAQSGLVLKRQLTSRRPFAIDMINGKRPDTFTGLVLCAASTQGRQLVAYVIPGGPADRAGLKKNDGVLELDGVDVQSGHDLVRKMIEMKPGEKLKLTITRDGQEMKVEIELARRPE